MSYDRSFSDGSPSLKFRPSCRVYFSLYRTCVYRKGNVKQGYETEINRKIPPPLFSINSYFLDSNVTWTVSLGRRQWRVEGSGKVGFRPWNLSKWWDIISTIEVFLVFLSSLSLDFLYLLLSLPFSLSRLFDFLFILLLLLTYKIDVYINETSLTFTVLPKFTLPTGMVIGPKRGKRSGQHWHLWRNPEDLSTSTYEYVKNRYFGQWINK